MRKLKIEELDRMKVEEFKKSRKFPVTIVLDDVRSLYNVGSLFRTSDSFRIRELILCGITATPENSLVEIHKTALGAEETVKWSYERSCIDCIKRLKEKGNVTVAVEQVEKSIKLHEVKLKSETDYVLIFGNEVKGIKQSVVDICDFSLEIPQYGTKHSLNVSVSAGIVLWEFYRQLKDILV
ncbi:MAG TPA: RNA methyltransferase [Bacteroidaceae bacterium]|nr:RNA methyltransferase [Bacteroidaceae bacterium]